MAEIRFDISELVNRAVDKLIESGWRPTEWIPCSERMPEFNEPVLTFDGQCISVERRIEYILNDDEEPIYGEWWIDGVEGDEEHPINLRDGTTTHWMPLPEPPESDGDSE